MVDFWQGKKVFVTGGAGFLGRHVYKLLQEKATDKNLLVIVPRSCDYDLRYLDDIERLFRDYGKPDIIINLAANVGGIGYNQAHPYQLFYDNMQIGINLIDQAIQNGVEKFVQIGTVCSYPKWAKPPFDEKVLWDGYPEETNAPYGLAKKMLLVQLQAARTEFGFNGIYLIPTNLYGPGDEFGFHRSHVIPALIRKFIEAREAGDDSVTVWGTGNASREFLYVKDAARAIVLATEKYDNLFPVNLGSGREVRIAWLAQKIKEMTGFEGDTKWDISKPDGQPRRGLDTKLAYRAFGWEAKTTLVEGLRETIAWYEQRRTEQTTPQELINA